MTETTHTQQSGASALLSPGEAARRLGVHIDTLRRWAADGKIESVRTPGGQRRFPESEVDRILAGVER